MANRMTRARIVTFGQAMAMIPTMTARMPSRIIEVDVDLNMTGISFPLAQAHQVLRDVRSACCAHQTPRPRRLANTCRLWTHSRRLTADHPLDRCRGLSVRWRGVVAGDEHADAIRAGAGAAGSSTGARGGGSDAPALLMKAAKQLEPLDGA